MQTILIQAFQETFALAPEVIMKAPGRVNLIGEHTDYNEGFVLPCAIDFHTLVAVSPRDDMRVSVIALDWDNERDEFAINAEISFHREQMWSNYIRGVVHELKRLNFPVRGCNLAVTGNVPQGAGLSSSAALEVAVTGALIAVAKGATGDAMMPSISPLALAQIGQAAENNFVGCACGIMDQLVSASGIAEHAVLIDCQSHEISPVAIPGELSIVIVNSNVQRGLVDSEYNLRRQQCEAVAAHFNVPSLRYLDLATLEAGASDLDPVTVNRARHVITENQRVLDTVQALKAGDFAGLSRFMSESHESMKSLFEITVPEIDSLVDLSAAVIGDSGGVRMTGGGFGGCVVMMIPHPLVAEVCQVINSKYEGLTGLKPTIYAVKASAGITSVL